MHTSSAPSMTTPRLRAEGRRVGLLAGWGRYPVVVAEELARQGFETCCLGVRGHTAASEAEQLAASCAQFDWVGLARLGSAIRYYRKLGVTRATMAGKIHKINLFEPWAIVRLWPDWRTVRRFYKHFCLARKDRRDDTLLHAVIDEFELDGIRFAPATDFVPELLVKYGQLTRRGPTAAQRKDIEFGWTLAKELGRLDVGQSVAVKGAAALAVEAIEGTDQCIQRAGSLCRAGGFTVVKVAKPQQDMRFDVPTIGLGTLRTLVATGGKCLAIEAGRTILIDEAEFIRFADQHGIAVVALQRDGQVPDELVAAECLSK